jgi:NAD-dependent SIR2 family protein deacetylase
LRGKAIDRRLAGRRTVYRGVVRIPEELVALAAERRLIPFVGAGFSASLGLPTWETMLRAACESIDLPISFEELLEATNNDFLQVAEYLFLKHDRQIGPIRHQIEKNFSRNATQPLQSGPHIELVNLGANQIYTTNYDDIIEQTYRALGLPVNSIILPKDVALSDTERTQVVKYHGDLAHDRTLVLTESAYYKRLDFESPMDLKFRSDLLGKSVLFMGYSFRDINIRIIWFKLMEMMRDIPEADRRPSYIVRIDPNPVLEELYAAVGLKTIVLNPGGLARTDDERSALIGEFLLSLSTRAATHALRERGEPSEVFVSRTAISRAQDMAKEMRPYRSHTFRMRGLVDLDDPTVARLLNGVVPEPLKRSWSEAVAEILPYLDWSVLSTDLIARIDASDSFTSFIVRILQTNGEPEYRAMKTKLIAEPTIWLNVWRNAIDTAQAEQVLETFAAEIRWQAEQGADEDILYLVDLAARMASGVLAISGDSAQELSARSRILLKVAGEIYPSVGGLEPSKEGAPELEAVRLEVTARAADFEAIGVEIPLFEPIRPTGGSMRTSTASGNMRKQRRTSPAQGRIKPSPAPTKAK